MGPGSIGVEVLAITGAMDGDGRRLPYTRGDRRWAQEWSLHFIDQELFDLISKDQWLRVRPVDARTLAAKRIEEAEKLEAEADAFEAQAKAKRVAAKAIREEAKEHAVKAAKAPPPAPAATPYQDAIAASASPPPLEVIKRVTKKH